MNSTNGIDSMLAQMRAKVEARAKAVAEAKAAQPPPTPDTPTPVATAPGTKPEPVRIKARRRYESGAEVKPLIKELQDAADADRPVDLEIE